MLRHTGTSAADPASAKFTFAVAGISRSRSQRDLCDHCRTLNCVVASEPLPRPHHHSRSLVATPAIPLSGSSCLQRAGREAAWSPYRARIATAGATERCSRRDRCTRQVDTSPPSPPCESSPPPGPATKMRGQREDSARPEATKRSISRETLRRDQADSCGRESFDDIYLDLSKQPGKCRLAESGLGWKPAGGATFTLDKQDMLNAQWSRAARGHELKVIARTAGVVQLDGFRQDVRVVTCNT
jgi:hypothetical protein